MKKYFKIQIETLSENDAEILVALLSEIKFYAFEEDHNVLNAYIKEKDFDEEKLKNVLPPKTIFKKYIIEEENWNQQWESGITPVIVKDFVAIRPSFAAAIKNVKYDLIITPKMSFGTGHHATTYLMVEMMERINFHNKSVVDFGTGTGVLAILAEKCGATKIIGVDIDEWSMKNATENTTANNCKNIALKQQSNLSGIDVADIVLANINRNVLTNEADWISSISKTGTLFLASGFLHEDEAEIQNCFEKRGFLKIRTKNREGWIAMLFKQL